MIDAESPTRHNTHDGSQVEDTPVTAPTSTTSVSRAGQSPAEQQRRIASGTSMAQDSTHPRIGDILSWALAVVACLWIGLCTGIGPLYWSDQGLAQFSWLNLLSGCIASVITFAIVVALVRSARGLQVLPHVGRHGRSSRSESPCACDSTHHRHRLFADTMQRARQHGNGMLRVFRRNMVSYTDRGWKIMLLLLVGWLWVPVTLLSAFGADICSQIREFSWAFNQWTGMRQPYIGFFSFVPMDIYPTAHYMWPTSPTYLTDQHNIVLTIFYGAITGVSRYFTDSNDLGIVVLSTLQYVFAAFCCASCADRFLNLPWRHAVSRAFVPERFTPRNLSHPEYGMLPGTPAENHTEGQPLTPPAGPRARALIMLFFLTCPLVIFSTISLTKSPVFAFAFLWWFGAGYELHMTRTSPYTGSEKPRFPRSRTTAAIIISTCIMMISAKYAWYLFIVQVLLLLIADRSRWKTYLVTLALPVLIIHGGMTLLFSTGTVISGDPIESRGIQLQQIARVAKLNPDGIPQSARELLSPIFNLDQMAASYFRQDADPVKSSGIQSKKVSYRWRSVTKSDMGHFNKAWFEIVKANPRIAMDAFLAKCFGYFDVNDQPYVSMEYYLTNEYVTDWSSWIKYWNPQWRTTVAQLTRGIGAIPVLGWLTHGNFYVVLTLLIGAAEVIERRWNTLVWHMPLLLLMGVMITSPANNFERHMLPVAFVFGFMALTFWRESRVPHGAASPA